MSDALEQLTAERDELSRKLADMTKRRDMMQRRALNNADAMHDLERQNRVLQARLTLLEHASATPLAGGEVERS